MMFSIITPSYNSGKDLKRCMRSLALQSFNDFELVLINDGSTDNSIESAKEYIEKINCQLINVTNSGVSNARNIGIEKAKGDYILFLDADDELASDCLAEYREAINKNTEVDLIITGFVKCYPLKTKKVGIETRKEVLAYSGVLKEFDPFFSRFAGTVWGKCYKRTLIGDNRFNKALRLCEDAEFNYRVFLNANNIEYLNVHTYLYYYSMKSTIRKYNPKNVSMYIKAIETILNQSRDTAIVDNIYEFSATVLNVICFNNIYVPDNKLKGKEKRQLVKKICENTVFCEVLKRIKLNTLSFSHRVSVLALKNRLYFAIDFLSVINRLLNKMRY